MFKYFYFLLFTIVVSAQNDSIVVAKSDSTKTFVYYLDEVDLFGNNADQLAYKILRRRVYKVYGFAKMTAANLDKIDKTLSTLKSKKDKKKYFKIAEKYLTNIFEPRLKKLSYNDAMILIKLINRQTGSTAFDLIKDYKSGFKAVISNSTARIFSLNLKKKYNPQKVKEDFLIEKILQNAFMNFTLTEQQPAKAIDFQKLKLHWSTKE